jgi:opacity protein-like surface antigen
MHNHIVRSAVLTLAALTAAAVPAAAQDGFLFRTPVIGFTLRGGPMLFTAGGDLLNEMRDRLTLERGDFRSAAFGAEVVFMPTSRFDVVLGVMHSSVEQRSEFRDWVEPDPVTGEDIPIEQTTSLKATPATLSVRYQLVPRGRRISELAWLPSRTNPYIGGGAGVTFYQFRQIGDFVDETVDPAAIFTDDFETTGQQLSFHGLAGIDYWVNARVGLNAEARYTHASASPQQSYRSYDTLDLGGLQATLGLSIRW